MVAKLKLAAGGSDVHFAVHKERRHGFRPAEVIIVHSGLPDHVSRVGIQRDQRRIKLSYEHLPVADGHTAIGLPAADGELRKWRDIGIESPLQRTVHRIKREHVAMGRGDVHRVFDHDTVFVPFRFSGKIAA